MCVFSSYVEQVCATSIFARLDGGEQHLAYAMELTAAEEVAMILPLPIAPGGEPTFVDLEGYPDLFEDLASVRYQAQLHQTEYGLAAGDHTAAPAPLEVQRVGAFDASFVPDPAAFDRLDPRFRLPDAAREALLERYADWGFVVFQLGRGRQQVHPMALRFPTRHPDRVFFPTLHVHDGAVHGRAEFDHALYLQAAGVAVCEPGSPRDKWGFEPSSIPLDERVDVARSGGLLVQGVRGHRAELRGRFSNEDVVVSLAPWTFGPPQLDFPRRTMTLLATRTTDGREAEIVLPLLTRHRAAVRWVDEGEPQQFGDWHTLGHAGDGTLVRLLARELG